MDIRQQTMDLIDSLKAICHNNGLGNDGNASAQPAHEDTNRIVRVYLRAESHFFIVPVAKAPVFVLWVLKEMNDTCSFRLEHSMTENQKRRITLMRQNHIGYAAIANELKLPSSTKCS